MNFPRRFASVAFFSAASITVTTLAAFAAESPLALPDLTPAVRRSAGRLSFELLPKSFQKNPQLEMTVVTELTDYGKTLPLVSPEHPAYYFGVNGGFIERGESVANDHTPDPNYLGRVLRHALETSGFLAADKTHPPTLALFFHWGSHAAMDRETRSLFPEKANRDLLERAVLVGGRTFQKSISHRLAYGDSPLDHAAKLEFLTEQAASDLYFVVVSAYDYEAFRHQQRKLVWRSNLTVDAIGVSMVDALPALVLTGGPYFGQPMPESEILLRTVRRGKVELGPTKVIEADVPVSLRKK